MSTVFSLLARDQHFLAQPCMVLRSWMDRVVVKQDDEWFNFLDTFLLTWIPSKFYHIDLEEIGLEFIFNLSYLKGDLPPFYS